MLRKDMLRRLGEGEDPLELSIEKWKDIIEGKEDDTDNCALCKTNICSNCIADSDGWCCGGYYDAYVIGCESGTYHKELAIDVYDYLCSLRKK